MFRAAIAVVLFCGSAFLFARTQFDYQLVNLIKIEKKNFKKAENESNVYTEISFPQCKTGGEPVLDIGDYYLGSDCFSGDKQYVKIKHTETSWRVHIAYCYSNHLYDFNRTARVFCRYPVKAMITPEDSVDS